MSNPLALLGDFADNEFSGPSINGASLMETLLSLDAAQAAFGGTYEGYSAWSVALHVAYCKHLVASALLDEAARAALGSYPYPEGDVGFADPPDAGPTAWKAFLDYLPRLHATLSSAIHAYVPDGSVRQFEAWEMPLDKAVVWVCSHDSYHTAQIRNMGLPSLREKRIF